MSESDRRRAADVRIGRIDDSEAADAFDRDFWARVPPAERLASVWDLVLDHLLLTRPDEAELGLQRSLCRVERRPG